MLQSMGCVKLKGRAWAGTSGCRRRQPVVTSAAGYVTGITQVNMETQKVGMHIPMYIAHIPLPRRLQHKPHGLKVAQYKSGFKGPYAYQASSHPKP